MMPASCLIKGSEGGSRRVTDEGWAIGIDVEMVGEIAAQENRLLELGTLKFGIAGGGVRPCCVVTIEPG